MSDLSLASSHSTQISLQEIRNREAGLNAHRQSMLDRVPEIGDWAALTGGETHADIRRSKKNRHQRMH